MGAEWLGWWVQSWAGEWGAAAGHVVGAKSKDRQARLSRKLLNPCRLPCRAELAGVVAAGHPEAACERHKRPSALRSCTAM